MLKMHGTPEYPPYSYTPGRSFSLDIYRKNGGHRDSILAGYAASKVYPVWYKNLRKDSVSLSRRHVAKRVVNSKQHFWQHLKKSRIRVASVAPSGPFRIFSLLRDSLEGCLLKIGYIVPPLDLCMKRARVWEPAFQLTSQI